MASDSEIEVDPQILALPGVGPSTAKKLADSGFNSIESIAVAAIGEISTVADIGENCSQSRISERRLLTR